MTITLTGTNVAILTANGFDEHQMTEIQRALIKGGAVTKTIAPETGVINGWQGDAWGHYFPVDISINDALGSDFEALVIPGGERGIAKLKSNLHARRIINHFLEAGKPIAAIENGVGLLALSPKIATRKVSAPQSAQKDLLAAGALVTEDEQNIDENILSSDGRDIGAWVSEAIKFFGVAPDDGLSVAA